MRIEQLKRDADIELRWTVFPLHPETPEDGQSLEELFAGRFDVASALKRLNQVAQSLGLPFGARSKTYNSRRAQELGKWAEEQGQGDAFRAAVYRAYFVDGRNIAKPAELATIVSAIGFSSDEALQVLADRTFADAVDADWERSRDLAVSSVPTHRYADRALVGFQEYSAFRQLIAD